MNEWIDASIQKPPCEKEVLIKCRRVWKTYSVRLGADIEQESIFITTAMYEDGTMNTEESNWNWYECDFEYDEENDWWIIPEGWWEYNHFNDDDEYNNEVDCEVVAWMELPVEFHERVIEDE